MLLVGDYSPLVPGGRGVGRMKQIQVYKSTAGFDQR
jgi:hypothetical protein